MKRLIPQLRILMMFNGICRTNARMQTRRLIMAGRSEKSHVVMYSRNGEVDQRAGGLVLRSLWAEEEVGKMSGSIVPWEDSRRVRKKNILV